MPIKIIKGNIFTSNAKVLVNTVNCEGFMGAGIALEYRLRFPHMYEQYVNICEEELLRPGKLWIYKGAEKWVLNFPTKDRWRSPSKDKYLRDGLEKFRSTYKYRQIESIAFPLLGAQNGGLEKGASLALMRTYLDDLDIDIEIYEYDPCIYDDLYLKLRESILNVSPKVLSEVSGLRLAQAEKVIEAVESGQIFQINQLLKVKGLGAVSIEKLFAFALNSHAQLDSQQPLF
ncbi:MULTISPECIES: macro domain-containing protein [Enterobacteriaceae]|uniref:macro domain-containing protein n=1 Tax=Enterobacteriaceae TaxID=543 RepID=UPI0010911C5D|nr:MULTISPECIES: macro domain-containing protein [Enterobacteriaceae]EHA3283596.1 Appr-1-p processing protein [Salmonella enterica]MBW9389601.1 Appr-1-p processing protein [Enterobacter sp. EC_62]MDV1059498.1 macro domain-containing protein [Klebsiella quasipneumoniae subsp. similipneumoniae]VGD61833.1 Appr-1-p processing protein [Klebsiella pneumoniae]HBR8006173.1 macro domain-containing protein [Klebsiella pneumoniae]